MQGEYDFSKYESSYNELARLLPEFESRFALSLDERRKYSVFSSILERYLIQVEASDSMLIAKARKSFIRAVVEELTLYLHNLYDEVFSDISLEKAKKLAKESVIKCSSKLESKLTYGEIDFFSFVNILERLQPKKGDLFVDLGHGTGRSMVCADLLYGHMFRSICGVEIIPELNAASEGVLEKLKEVLKDCDHIFASHSAALSVYEGDFTVQDYFDWTSVDIIFANSTCFDESLMEFLSGKASEMKPGARIVTLTRNLDNPALDIIEKRQYTMSWGTATCFVHIRRDV